MSGQQVTDAATYTLQRLEGLFDLLTLPEIVAEGYAARAEAAREDAKAARDRAEAAAGGVILPPNPGTGGGFIARLKAAAAAAPTSLAGIAKTSRGTPLNSVAGEGLNPIRVPGANGQFKRIWFQNGSNGNGNRVAEMYTLTHVENVPGFGLAVGGLAQFNNSDGSQTRVVSSGGASAGDNGSISDISMGFELTGRGFGVVCRIWQLGSVQVYVSENGGPLLLCEKRMVWSHAESWAYMDFDTVATRKFVVVCRANMETGEIAIAPNATITPYDWTADKYLYSMAGDSWLGCVESTFGYSLPQGVAKLCGAHGVTGTAIGGTGYIANTNGDHVPLTAAVRLDMLNLGLPEVVDCCMIVNDPSNNIPALKDAVNLVIAGIKSRNPNALAVFTVWASSGDQATNVNGGTYLKADAIRSCVRAITGMKWMFQNGLTGEVETSDGTKSPATGPVITGQGSVAGPANDGGNADVAIDEPNGRHPADPAGVRILVEWKAAKFKVGLAAMADDTVVTPAPGTGTFAIFNFEESTVGASPATYANSVAGGINLFNWGENKGVGGQTRANGPFGKAWHSEGGDGNRAVLTSDATVTFTSVFTLEFLASLRGDLQLVMQYSTSGRDTDAVYMRVEQQQAAADGSKVFRLMVKTSAGIEVLDGVPVFPVTINGVANMYHVAVQRESNDKITLRSQSKLLATSVGTLSGSLTGNWDAFGGYNRAIDHVDTTYQSLACSIRGSRSAVYSGATYTAPAARFLTSGDNGSTPVTPPTEASVSRVLIGGASQETDAFAGNGSAQIQAAQARIFAATGKTVSLQQYAVSGMNTQHFSDVQWPQMKAANLAGTPGETLVLICIGGNDVTPNVPITLPNQHLINQKARLETVIAEIEALGWDWCLVDLTFRDYSTPTYLRDRTKGSWAWNTAVSKPINAARTRKYNRDWRYSDGTSWADCYSFIRNNRQYLVSDGIHHTDPDGRTAHRNFLVDSAIIPAITRTPLPQIARRDEQSGVSLAVSISSVTPIAGGFNVTSTANYQGVWHYGAYAVGSAPTAANVVAGTGTGFVAKVAVNRLGQIEVAATDTVSGLAGSTAYALKAVFVSDTNVTSSVQSQTATTGATATNTATVVLVRANALASPRANINQVLGSAGSTTTGVKIANLVDLLGANTGIGINVTAAFSQTNDAGNTALSVAGKFNAGELGESWYVGGNPAVMDFTGLNPSKTYDITFAGSRSVAFNDATPRVGELSVTAGTVVGTSPKTYNAANPETGATAGNAVISVTPTAGGVATLSLRPVGSGAFAYVSGIHIVAR